MNLTRTRPVTTNVAKLAHSYEGAKGASASVLSSGYVEFQNTPCGRSAIAELASIRSYERRGNSLGSTCQRSHNALRLARKSAS
jgi:hypothetical protein